jgi:hypothetical protein
MVTDMIDYMFDNAIRMIFPRMGLFKKMGWKKLGGVRNTQNQLFFFENKGHLLTRAVAALLNASGSADSHRGPYQQA